MIKAANIHEDILRHLWARQYLDHQHLTTIDGSQLHIVEPGKLNRGSGPDFREGVIVLDGKIYRGDIEFHRSTSDWENHSHGTDDKYNSVILHVVFCPPSSSAQTISASGRSIPVFAIAPFLSSPLEKILEHTMRDEHLSRTAPLRCFHHADVVDAVDLENWIHTLSVQRMKEKAVTMLARLLEIVEEQRRTSFETQGRGVVQQMPGAHAEAPGGEDTTAKEDIQNETAWQQLLYEGIMDGLGYSNNRVPFVTLAQRVSVMQLLAASRSRELSALELESVLFHISGLLLSFRTVLDQDSKVRLHELRTSWDQLRATSGAAGLASLETMSSSDWSFSPTRPANFPTSRMAVASDLLGRIISRRLLARLVSIVGEPSTSPADKVGQLLGILDIDEDSYWSFHYTFTESSPRRHSRLGDMRKHDIIVNTVLPLCSLYAVVFELERVHDCALEIAGKIPLLESNFITRKIERQLLEGKLCVRSAFHQQGTIQLYERYCAANRCHECNIGRKVFNE